MGGDKHLWTLTFDGGASPNPGKASCAFKRENGIGQKSTKSWKMIGIHSNNEAEWNAVATGIEEIMKVDPQAHTIKIMGDSQLVIYQIQGIYRVKSKDLYSYYKRICAIRDKYDVDLIPIHIEREFNTEMDEACKSAR